LNLLLELAEQVSLVDKPRYIRAMSTPHPDAELLQTFIRRSLSEDIGPGDYTSLATIPAGRRGRARLLVKDHGVLCGMPIAKAVFNYLDPSCEIEDLLSEGDDISPGQEAFYVEGPIRTLLGGERLVLNTMQRLSGIANMSRVFAKAVEGTNAKVLDTRKTTPQLRFLEKYAVVVGGCHNYRDGLYDRIMIKDNHVDGAGGMREAIEGVHEYLKANNLDLMMTVEVRNLEELDTVLSIGNIQRIMLDNFELSDLKTAVKTINGRHESEASGGVNLKTIRPIAETGVDYISVGALTHSAQSIDLSLKMMS